MTDEKLQYTLTLATVATGTGARDTAREMEYVAAATALASNKASVSEWGFYDLDHQLIKTADSTKTFTTNVTKMQGPVRNNAQALLMFSQGLEDSTYGLRGVLNNIPGLVMALGGGMGLAGAISIGAVALSQIIPLFTKVEEKSSDVADRIKEVSDNMAAMEAERFEEVGEAIDVARDRAAALKQEFDDTRAAENSFSTAALDNAGKLSDVQRTIAEALGAQVDHYRELQAIAEAEAEKRRLAAEQAIQSERDKLNAAQETVTAAEDYLVKQRNRADSEQANLESMRAQLEALRQQKAELEKIAQQRTTSDDPGRQLIGAIFPKTLPLSDQAKAARSQLEDQVFRTQLEGTEKKVAELERAVETLVKDGGVVTRAENAFLAAQTQLTDLSSAVATNIERIEQTLAADDLIARSQTLAASQEQQAKDLKTAVTQIETTTEAGRAAKAAIEAAAADGRITANESQQVAQASGQIIGQIQAGLATASGNTQQVLTLLRTVAEQEAKNGREIQSLKQQVSQLFSRLR